MLRGSLAALALAALLAAPVAALVALGPGAAPERILAGTLAAIRDVGWVLVPQLALGVGVLGLALRQGLELAAGGPGGPVPAWLEPAVESALLLGMLGTISGMVRGFVGLSPEELEPGPLVHSLGTALRSSFVGFAIALVGVWTRGPAERQRAA